MAVEVPLSAELDRYLTQIERALQSIFADLRKGPYAEMGRMVDHHFGWDPEKPDRRGKRIRPLLTLQVCQAAGGDWNSALPAASAIEIIHNFSLIHDDIEDQSESRRGRTTLWVEWGLPQALNTGDALLILSQLCALRLRDRGVVPARTLDILQELNSACLQLTFGQHLDLAFESRAEVSTAEYLAMIRGKTASLIAAATAVGAMLSNLAAPRQIEYYRDFGLNLGMAFQLQDDVLGIWGSPSVTGKPAGDDLTFKKKTLPVIIGLNESPEFVSAWTSEEPARGREQLLGELLKSTGALQRTYELAEEHTQAALNALEKANPDQECHAQLQELAGWLLARRF